MTPLPPIDTDYMLSFLTGLLNTPSPTGFAHRAIDFTAEALSAFPFLEISRTRKGALLVKWGGHRSDAPRALTAHADTLGAMVKEIKPSGRLKLTKIGGYAWNTVEGEGCTVFTNAGGTVRGSLLLAKASSHVHGAQVSDTKREDDAMEVRLDAKTSSREETLALGIQVGDFVAFDPRVEVTNGFVRSRHLDDKACVANIVAAVKALADAGLQPAQTTYFLISNYEEVGHGAAAGIPPEVTELLAVDMAAIGEGQMAQGLIYVIVFSLGLTTVLVAIGLAMVGAASFARDRLPGLALARWARLASGVLVTTLGLYLVIEAIMYQNWVAL